MKQEAWEGVGSGAEPRQFPDSGVAPGRHKFPEGTVGSGSARGEPGEKVGTPAALCRSENRFEIK